MISLSSPGDTEVIEGSQRVFQVTLDAPATLDTVIAIALSPSAVATAPATVTIPAGFTTAAFDVTTSNVSGDTPFVVTASLGTDSDTVQMTILDGDGGGNPPPPNQPPVAHNDSYTVTENSSLHVQTASGVIVGRTHGGADTDPEHDPLAAIMVHGPQHGVLTLNFDGSFDYTPSPGFTGQDSFTYLVNDGRHDSNIATATLNVQPVEQTSQTPQLLPADDGAVLEEGSTLTLLVSLDAPAGPGGETVSISVNPASLGLAPATVTVLEGQTTAAFTVTASSVDHDEVMSITATDQDKSATYSVQVLDVSGFNHVSGATGGGDALAGGGGPDLVHGDSGNDLITGGGGNDILFGDAGNDRLNGGAGNDLLVGGDGNDVIAGSVGSDEMHGNAGNDTYLVDSTADQVIEFANQGIDTVRTTVANYSSIVPNPAGGGMLVFNGYALQQNVENLTLDGTNALDGVGNDADNRLTGNAAANILLGDGGNDILNGNAGDDRLIGGKGNDQLQGGDGNDVLAGGIGKDVLTGGAGSDTFVFQAINDSSTATGRDTIADFTAAVDHIDLSAIDAITGTPGNDGFHFVGSGGLAHAGDLRVGTVNGNTMISADVNGDHKADFQIVLTGIHTLTAGDFIL